MIAHTYTCDVCRRSETLEQVEPAWGRLSSPSVLALRRLGTLDVCEDCEQRAADRLTGAIAADTALIPLDRAELLEILATERHRRRGEVRDSGSTGRRDLSGSITSFRFWSRAGSPDAQRTARQDIAIAIDADGEPVVATHADVDLGREPDKQGAGLTSQPILRVERLLGHAHAIRLEMAEVDGATEGEQLGVFHPFDFEEDEYSKGFVGELLHRDVAVRIRQDDVVLRLSIYSVDEGESDSTHGAEPSTGDAA